MRRFNSTTARTLSAVAVLALVVAGLAFRIGFGTPSIWGLPNIAAICPLGGLEVLLAGGPVLVPTLLVGVGVAVAITLVTGRAFCGWGCPVPLLKRIVRPSKRPGGDISAIDLCESASSAPARGRMLSGCAACRRGTLRDSRSWVLGGALATTVVFGFPVFCLICPVGLTVATIVGLWQAFKFSELSWGLLIFPAILVLEVVVLKKWCHSFCPLGFLLTLISRGNRLFRPKIRLDKCLRNQGVDCRRCVDACPEQIDLHPGEVSAPLASCTKCRACVDECPADAIQFPLFEKSGLS